MSDSIQLRFSFNIGDRKNVIMIEAYPDVPFKDVVLEACKRYGLDMANIAVVPSMGSAITATELNEDSVESIVEKYGLFYNIIDRGIVGVFGA